MIQPLRDSLRFELRPCFTLPGPFEIADCLRRTGSELDARVFALPGAGAERLAVCGPRSVTGNGDAGVK